MVKLSDIMFENLEDREKNIQSWLDATLEAAPGKDRGEKLEYSWKHDPRTKELWSKVKQSIQ